MSAQVALKLVYPHKPGFKQRDTSKAAAKAVNGRHREVWDRILEKLRQYELNVDELASMLDLDAFYLRPRVSELAKQGVIVDSGIRREGDRGKKMICWRVR